MSVTPSITNRRIAVSERAVRSVAFSSNSLFLAVGSADTIVSIFQLPSLKKTHEFNHKREVNCVAISPTSCQYVMSCGDDGKCKVWNLTTNQKQNSFSVSETSLAYSCVISGDETKCIACAWDGTVSVFTFPHGFLLCRLGAHNDVVMSIACDLAFTRALSACWDGTCAVWNLNEMTRERDLDGHEGKDCNAVAICQHTGKLGVSGSNDKTVAVWNLDTGDVLHRLCGHGDIIVGVALHTILLDSHTVAKWRVMSAGWDGNVRLYDGENPQQVRGLRITQHRPKAACVAFSKSGNWYASGGFDGDVTGGDLHVLDRKRLMQLIRVDSLPTDIVMVVRSMLF